MKYVSTRGISGPVEAAQAILQGIAPDGGLYVPETLPRLTQEDFARMCRTDYCGRARIVLEKFLTGFAPSALEACVERAYGGERFENGLPAPIAKLGGERYLLELWHGPTCAFKDIALQLLPHLMAESARMCGVDDEVVILTATSGDTGKAALEGFADAPGTRILVFYPRDGVSAMQKLQMRAQRGANVGVCGVLGNFDDAQAGVKQLFTDPALARRLRERHLRFSSANSINWGRLVPQIVYYLSAYCDLVLDEEIAAGEPLNVAVPTGNFGDILAAYYAKRMGAPIGRLICASNRNNVLTDFIESGVYDRNREFYQSLSPSMDILISSNLERLLFELCGRDAARVRSLMAALAAEGRYAISPQMGEALRADFAAGFCDDEGTRAAIRSAFESYGYLLDTHTAVACRVYEGYRERTGDDAKTLIVSTASPFKFADSVCGALGIAPCGEGPFAPADALQAATGKRIPPPIEALRHAAPRFDEQIARDRMAWYVERALGLA